MKRLSSLLTVAGAAALFFSARADAAQGPVSIDGRVEKIRTMMKETKGEGTPLAKWDPSIASTTPHLFMEWGRHWARFFERWGRWGRHWL